MTPQAHLDLLAAWFTEETGLVPPGRDGETPGSLPAWRVWFFQNRHRGAPKVDYPGLQAPPRTVVAPPTAPVAGLFW